MSACHHRFSRIINNPKNDTAMKEKILEAFKALGFEMEELEGMGYGFQYEGKHFLYMYNEDDEDFLNISLPGVLDIDDENNTTFYQVMDKLNGTLKYVKAYKLNDGMWLFYERELFGGEDLKQVLSRMILHLEAALMFLRRAMADSDDGDGGTATDASDADKEEVA